MQRFRIEHIGYLTVNIGDTAKSFEMLGYKAGRTVDDDTQQTRICFLHKEGEVNIELVEPYESNRTMQKMLVKQGVSPYHTCYEVDDIDEAYKLMMDSGWTALFEPVASPAFNNRRICYFWKRDVGLIELVNK